MPLNSKIQLIVGKKIQSVIVKNKDHIIKRDLLYLVFSDGMSMEIYGDDVNNAKQMWADGASVAKHSISPEKPTFEYHSEE